MARGERGDKAYDFRHVLLNSVAFNKISADNQQIIRAATGNAPSSGRAFSIGDVWYYDAGSNLASSTVGSVADVFPVVILRQQAMPFSIINGGNFIPLETQREALSGMGKTTTVLRSACAQSESMEWIIPLQEAESISLPPSHKLKRRRIMAL